MAVFQADLPAEKEVGRRAVKHLVPDLRDSVEEIVPGEAELRTAVFQGGKHCDSARFRVKAVILIGSGPVACEIEVFSICLEIAYADRGRFGYTVQGTIFPNAVKPESLIGYCAEYQCFPHLADLRGLKMSGDSEGSGDIAVSGGDQHDFSAAFPRNRHCGEIFSVRGRGWIVVSCSIGQGPHSAGLQVVISYVGVILQCPPLILGCLAPPEFSVGI